MTDETKTPAQLLLSIAGLDRQVATLNASRDEIVRVHDQGRAEIDELKGRVDTERKQYDQILSKQAVESQRLKEEEQRIVERRRQLTAIGGIKSAKLFERDIETASKSLQTLEENIYKVLESGEELKKVLDKESTLLTERETEYSTRVAQDEERLAALETNLKETTAKRDELVQQLDNSLRKLYERVRSRYPGEPVARAAGGSCRSCFRTLPPQLFNQVLSGISSLQCPGCSRILVAESADENNA